MSRPHERPHHSTCAATKAAIKNLTESLRMAHAGYDIRFCNIAPAKIQTPLRIESYLNSGQVISVEIMAETVLWVYEPTVSVCIRDLVIAPTQYEA